MFLTGTESQTRNSQLSPAQTTAKVNYCCEMQTYDDIHYLQSPVQIIHRNYLCWKKWHWNTFLSAHFGVSLSKALQHCPIFILHPVPLFTFSILCFSSTLVHCGPRRPIQSPFLSVSGHFVPNDYSSQCLQIPFSFISLIITWSSFFPCSAHSGCRYFFLAFFRYSSCQYFRTILTHAIQ